MTAVLSGWWQTFPCEAPPAAGPGFNSPDLPGF
jgi:hypothetical protein